MELRDQLQATLGSSYTIEQELTGGGMSRVFVAREARLGRSVVVKVLPPETVAAVSAERFKREIQVAATLQHPHIVPLLFSGETEGLPFYTMPFVKGESLRERLAKGGALSVRDAIHVLRDVASALAYAHAEGVVHRDIKPANIMLSGGVAVVTDFGVAKAMWSAATESEHRKEKINGLTSLGVAIGTPAYMSPEQAGADENLDQRSDIYSFGCLAYELLCGTSPFAGRTSMHQLLVAHMTEAPEPLSKRRPQLPAALVALVMKCLEKRPADRPQSASELLIALDSISTPAEGTAAMRVGGVRVRRTTAILLSVGVAVVVIAAVTVARWLREPSFKPFVAGRSQALTSASQLEVDAAVSPDANFVAYTVGRVGQMRIIVRPVSGGRPLVLASDMVGNQEAPQWAPDSKWIAFRAGGAIYRVRAPSGGEIQRIGPSASAAAWSPDGKQLAYSNDGIWIAGVEGGAPRKVANVSGSAPAWSPDGKSIALVVGAHDLLSSNSPSGIRIIRLDRGTSVPVTDSVHANRSPAWAPDSRSLLFVSNVEGASDVYQQELNGNGTPHGGRARITTGLNAYTISLSSDGLLMAYTTLALRANVWVAPIGKTGITPFSAARQVTTSKQAIEAMSVSHDGKWLAYDSNLNGNPAIFKIALDPSAQSVDPVRLTHDSGSAYAPVWSPDDREIAYYSTAFGKRDIFVMGADGRNPQRVTDMDVRTWYPDWSPDGTRLVFTHEEEGGRTYNPYVVTRAADGHWSSPVAVGRGAGGRGSIDRWSPDGRYLSATSGDSLFLIDVATGARTPIIEPIKLGLRVTAAEWGRDGALFFHTSTDGNDQFWSINKAGGAPRLVLRLDDPTRVTNKRQFATDGRQLFFTIAEDEGNAYLLKLKR